MSKIIKSTAQIAQEKYEEQTKKMVREATIICGTIIVLAVVIIAIGLKIT